MEDIGLTYTPLPMFSARARHVTGEISAGACGCDMGSAAGREGWRNSPQPRAAWVLGGQGALGRGMPCMKDVGLTYTPLPMFSAQARHVTARISAGPVDVTWVVLLAAIDGAIPLSHELDTWLASPMHRRRVALV